MAAGTAFALLIALAVASREPRDAQPAELRAALGAEAFAAAEAAGGGISLDEAIYEALGESG